MNAKTYQQRRTELREAVPGGAILFLGAEEAPRNYPANPYPFRQDSHFLYYAGTALPGLALLIEPDGTTTLFGPPEDPDDLVWHGPHPVLADHAAAAGVERTAEIGDLARKVRALRDASKRVRYLPPYRGEAKLALGALLDVHPAEVGAGACPELAEAVVRQRSIKSDAEVAEIERALEISKEMYAAAMERIRPGATEAQVVGATQGWRSATTRPSRFCRSARCAATCCTTTAT